MNVLPHVDGDVVGDDVRDGSDIDSSSDEVGTDQPEGKRTNEKSQLKLVRFERMSSKTIHESRERNENDPKNSQIHLPLLKLPQHLRPLPSTPSLSSQITRVSLHDQRFPLLSSQRNVGLLEELDELNESRGGFDGFGEAEDVSVFGDGGEFGGVEKVEEMEGFG